MMEFKEYIENIEGLTMNDFDGLLQPAINEIKNRWLDSVKYHNYTVEEF